MFVHYLGRVLATSEQRSSCHFGDGVYEGGTSTDCTEHLLTPAERLG